MRSDVTSANEFFRASRAKSVHSLQVPRQTDQTPFAAGARHSAQRELAEFHHVLDQAEHRLDGALAQCVQLATASRFQPMAHSLQCSRLALKRRWLGPAFKQRWMMLLSAQRDQRLHLGLRTGVDIVLAGIARVGDQLPDPSQFWRQAFQWGKWHFTLNTLDVDVSGPLAVERGKYVLRFKAGPGAPTGMASFEDRGNYLVHWRREADGQWRAVGDAPVSELPLPSFPGAGKSNP